MVSRQPLHEELTLLPVTCTPCSYHMTYVATAVCNARTIAVVEVVCAVEGVVAAEVTIPNVVDNLVKHDIDVCGNRKGKG